MRRNISEKQLEQERDDAFTPAHSCAATSTETSDAHVSVVVAAQLCAGVNAQLRKHLGATVRLTHMFL